MGVVGVVALMLVTAVTALVVVVTHHVTAAVSTLPAASSAPSTSSPRPGSTSTTGPATDAARASAITFADEALPQIVSYDYRSYATHIDAATRLMTPAYGAKFRATSAALADGVTRLRATITATVSGAGLAGIADDTAQVLVFLDQRTQRGGHTQVQASAVTVSLRTSNGGWLVDGIDTGTTVTPVVEPDPRRQAIITAATQEASAFANFDYAEPDVARGAVLAGATGDFARQFTSSFATLASTARKLRSVTTGEVTAAGIATYDAQSATVLVSTTGSTRSAASGPTPQFLRLRLTLVPVGGQWLVSELTAVS